MYLYEGQHTLIIFILFSCSIFILVCYNVDTEQNVEYGREKCELTTECCIYMLGSCIELLIDGNFSAQPWMSRYCDHPRFLLNFQSRHLYALFQVPCCSLPFLFSLDILRQAYELRLSVPG